jgi:hypothetical protein
LKLDLAKLVGGAARRRGPPREGTAATLLWMLDEYPPQVAVATLSVFLSMIDRIVSSAVNYDSYLGTPVLPLEYMRKDVGQLNHDEDLATEEEVVAYWRGQIRAGESYNRIRLPATTEYDRMVPWIANEVERIFREEPPIPLGPRRVKVTRAELADFLKGRHTLSDPYHQPYRLFPSGWIQAQDVIDLRGHSRTEYMTGFYGRGKRGSLLDPTAMLVVLHLRNLVRAAREMEAWVAAMGPEVLDGLTYSQAQGKSRAWKGRQNR